MNISVPVLIILLEYGVGAFFGILFLIALARTDWFRHTWGRNVMMLTGSLTLAELFAFSNLFLKAWPGRIWIGVVLLGLISSAQAWRWWIQFSGNRRQRRQQEALKQEASV